MSDDLSALVGFKGCAPLFPLPNLVLFPHVVQPLHIFEQRYRQMTHDALQGDRLIAMVLLQPGWEAHYGGSPAVFPIACLGKIVADQKLDDGRYNILLRGLSRICILKELPHQKLYRQAQVEILAEPPEPAQTVERKWRRQMAHYAPRWFPNQPDIMRHFRQLLSSDLSLGSLCDILAFALPLDVEFKQELLEELDVVRRAKRLVQHLKNKTPAKPEPIALSGRKFPPDFSDN